jgi:hypothetical protein
MLLLLGNSMEERLHELANAVNPGIRTQSNQQLEELGWFLSGFLAGWYQGFFFPSLLVLLLIYLKVHPGCMEKYRPRP